MSDDAPITSPLRIADHEIVREIGRGGMGVVYMARQRVLDRVEALKVMNSSLIRDSLAAERFLREIRAAARLHHPNIVTAYSASVVDRTIAFAMEYVAGIDLAQLISTRGPLPVGEACHYVRDAALGLQHAFEQGMVHRDIKPSNLIVCNVGGRATVKILDFGLAKASLESVQGSGLTLAGQFLGTLEYISPEQAQDAANADTRSDIYSLGCTLYFLLTGAPPFRGSLLEVLRSHESTCPQSVHSLRGDAPLEVDAIVSRMLAKSPEERFANPGEVAQALVHFAIAPQASILTHFPIPNTPGTIAAWDTKSRASEPTLISGSKPRERSLMDSDAPWVARWFPAYCLFCAGVCLCALIVVLCAVVSELNPSLFGEPPLTGQDVKSIFLGAAVLVIPTVVGSLVFISGLFVKRRPITWAFGFALLLAGLCFGVPCPLSLVMMYYWIQEDTRRYFDFHEGDSPAQRGLK